MDFSYFEQVSDDKPDMNSPEYIATELEILQAIADKIGCYEYEYNEKAPSDAAEGLHIGPVAQELLEVPGLDSAVTLEDGIYKVKSDMVALACLGICAALARHIIGKTDENDSTEMDRQLDNSTEGTTETAGIGAETAGTASAPTAEAVAEPTVESANTSTEGKL